MEASAFIDVNKITFKESRRKVGTMNFIIT